MSAIMPRILASQLFFNDERYNAVSGRDLHSPSAASASMSTGSSPPKRALTCTTGQTTFFTLARKTRKAAAHGRIT